MTQWKICNKKSRLFLIIHHWSRFTRQINYNFQKWIKILHHTKSDERFPIDCYWSVIIVKERLRCIRLVDICITWWDRFSADSMALLDSFNYETSSFDLFHFVPKIIRSSTCHLVCMHNEKEIDFYSVLTHVYMLSLSVFFSRWRKKQTRFVFILTLLLYATIKSSPLDSDGMGIF